LSEEKPINNNGKDVHNKIACMQKVRFNSKLWRMPLLIAVVSIGGLVAALVGDGLWDLLSWITLSLPIILACKYLFK
jgi:hypothetical protein